MTTTFPTPTAISEDLITANLGLARQSAWRFHRKTGQPYDDLEAVAFVGLIRGCRKYDPARLNPANGKPYALSTIVVPFVQGEILHHLRDRGYAVKFPSKWRESWGKVQRLMGDPSLSAQDVAEQCGMPLSELTEMLSSMAGTANIDELHGADGYEVAEPEICRIDPLQSLVQQAWSKLAAGDQSLLCSWWSSPRRVAFPAGPLQQFHRRVKGLLEGRSLSEYRQLALLTVPLVTAERKPRRQRSKRPLDAAVLQLGLV